MARKTVRQRRSSTGAANSEPVRDPDLETFALRSAVYRLWRWMSGPESRPYYQSLSEGDQDRFDQLHDTVRLAHANLQYADLARLAARASVQRDDLSAAIGDLQRRLDDGRRLADMLGSISSFVNLILPLLL